MLSHIFDIKKEIYNNATMSVKIIYDIISAEANAKFSAKVTHILAKRNWEREEFDPCDRITSEHMNADMEAAIYLRLTLERLYESEYGKIDDAVKAEIDELSSEYAEIALLKFGWIKEENV